METFSRRVSFEYLPTYLLRRAVEVEADAERCLPRLAHVGNVIRVPLDGDGFGTAKQ